MTIHLLHSFTRLQCGLWDLPIAPNCCRLPYRMSATNTTGTLVSIAVASGLIRSDDVESLNDVGTEGVLLFFCQFGIDPSRVALKRS